MNFSTLFDQEDVKQLLAKFRSILRSYHFNTGIIMKSLYARKIRVKQILEILLQAQTANQKCGEIVEKLQRKLIELRCSLAGTEFPYTPSIDLNGLINDALNTFEICYGMPLHCTLPIRNLLRRQLANGLIEEWITGEIRHTNELSFDQKQVLIHAIDETLSLWKTCQNLFSWHAVSNLTTYSVADIAIGNEVPITLLTLILMARAIDNLKKKIPKEVAESVLSSLPQREAGWQMFYYTFLEIESHFDHLFDEYCDIHTQYFGASPYAPPMPLTSTPVGNTTPPLTWAEVAKKPISEPNKDLLSLYANSLQQTFTKTAQRHSQDRRKKISLPLKAVQKDPSIVLIDGVEKIFLRRDLSGNPKQKPSLQNSPPRSNLFTYLNTSEEEVDKRETEDEVTAATTRPLSKEIAKREKREKSARNHTLPPKQKKDKDDEDFLLLEQAIESNTPTQKTLSEIENIAQPPQEVDVVSKLIKRGNAFLSRHDRGFRGKEIRIEFVIEDLQEAETLLDNIEACYQVEKNGHKKRLLLKLKKEADKFRKSILEDAIPQFLQLYKEKTKVEVSLDALSKNWEIFLHFIEALHDIGKLSDYIEDTQSYFEPLLDSLSTLEEKYYVTHRVRLGSNPANEAIFRHLRACSGLFNPLYNIQLMCLNELQLDEIGCSTIVAALDDINQNGGRISSENLTLFFEQLMPAQQHKKIPAYIEAWSAYAKEEGYSYVAQLFSAKTNSNPLLFSHQAASLPLSPYTATSAQEEQKSEIIDAPKRVLKLR